MVPAAVPDARPSRVRADFSCPSLRSSVGAAGRRVCWFSAEPVQGAAPSLGFCLHLPTLAEDAVRGSVIFIPRGYGKQLLPCRRGHDMEDFLKHAGLPAGAARAGAGVGVSARSPQGLVLPRPQTQRAACSDSRFSSGPRAHVGRGGRVRERSRRRDSDGLRGGRLVEGSSVTLESAGRRSFRPQRSSVSLPAACWTPRLLQKGGQGSLAGWEQRAGGAGPGVGGTGLRETQRALGEGAVWPRGQALGSVGVSVMQEDVRPSAPRQLLSSCFSAVEFCLTSPSLGLSIDGDCAEPQSSIGRSRVRVQPSPCGG